MALFKQAYSAAIAPGLRGVTLGDLVREVKTDMSASGMQKSTLLSQISSVTGGASPGTPVSAFAAGAAGAIIANLAGKYFGMSSVGRTLVTAVGYGIGSQLSSRFGSNERKSTNGWQVYG